MIRFTRRTAARGLSALLAASLVLSSTPAAALAAALGEGESTSAYSGSYAEGEALVLYRTSATSDDVSLLSDDEAEAAIPGDAETDAAQAEAAELTSAGFELEGFWDLSAVDEAVEGSEVALLSDDESETDSASAAADASGIATGDDVRIALVSREGLSTETLIEQLEQLDCVIAAQPNYSHEVESVDGESSGDGESDGDSGESSENSVEPNDTYYQAGLQYYLYDDVSQDTSDDTTQGDTSDGADDGSASDSISESGATEGSIHVEAARAAREGGTQENVVAVVDTGVDYTNPDLAGVMWSRPADDELKGPLPGKEGDCGWNGVTNTGDPMPSRDSNTAYEASHGTHCAGIIAAQTNNEQGVAGNSADTKIMGLRTSEGAAELKDYAIVSCYQYLIQAKLAGVNVVAANCSWSYGNYVPVFDYLVNQAGRAGVLSIFAAGNNNADVAKGGILDSTGAIESPYAIVIAATNSNNEYTCFTNYNKTVVDLATPGSRILSTVSEAGAQQFYYPVLAREAGQDLAYYQDFSDGSPSEDDLSLSVSFGDEDVTEQCGKYASVKIVNSDDTTISSDNTTSYTYLDGNWLEVSLTYTDEMLKKMKDEGKRYSVSVEWKEDAEDCLPASTGDTSNYIFGYSVASNTEHMLRAYGSVEIRDGYGDEAVDPGTLASEQFRSTVDNDAYYAGTGGTYDNSVKCCSDNDKTVIFTAHFGEGDGSDIVANHTYKAAVTAIGVGKKSEAPAYAFMSGTSMATPCASGIVAQMAALTNSGELQTAAEALAVRGMVVGSTVPVKKSYTQYEGSRKVTATDGRFSWDVALGDDGEIDAEALNANTWGASTDTHSAGAETQTVTLHGYALEGASVTVDGGAASVVASSNDSITLALPTSLCDGLYHEFIVTDASSGRTYTASYALDAVDTTGDDAKVAGTMSLEQVGTLPTVEAPSSQASGTLCSSGESLYFADKYGCYVYRSADLTGSSWEELELGDWAGELGISGVPTLTYACLDGALYAFTTTLASDAKAGTFSITSWANRYDPASGLWSGFSEAGGTLTQDYMIDLGGGYENFVYSPAVQSCSAFAYQGEMFLLVDVSLNESSGSLSVHGYKLMAAPLGSDDFEDVSFALVSSGGELLPYIKRAIATDSGIVALGSDAVSGVFYPTSYDEEAAKWHVGGTLSGLPSTLTSNAAGDAQSTAQLVANNGVLLLGDLFGDSAQARFVNLETGTWSLLAVEGDVLEDNADAVVLGGTMTANGYLVAATGGKGAADGALYAVTFSEGAGVEYEAATLRAAAGAGGTAAVAASAGVVAGGSLTILKHQNATWTASAASGYSFTGWYDEEGELVSTDASYTAAVLGDEVLEARFEPVSSGGGSGTSGGSGTQSGGGSSAQPGGATVQSASAGGKRAFPQTGDDTSYLLPAVLAVAGVALVAVAVVVIRRRK